MIGPLIATQLRPLIRQEITDAKRALAEAMLVRKAITSRPFVTHIKAAEKHYHGQLITALRLGLDPAQIARDWAASAKRVSKADVPDDLSQAARLYASNLPTDPAELQTALESLYGEGSVIGAKEALERLRAAGASVTLGGLSGKADALDWDRWTAGNAGAASELAGLDGGAGLASLLDQSGVTIKSLQETRLDQLAGVLADGAARGDSVDALTSDIRDLLDDPSRAELIANTELNRAVTASTLSTYEQNGIEEWDLLVYNPCPDCEDVEAGNPHDLSEDGPPIHPGCRCAAAPHIPSEEV